MTRTFSGDNVSVRDRVAKTVADSVSPLQNQLFPWTPLPVLILLSENLTFEVQPVNILLLWWLVLQFHISATNRGG